MGRVNDREYAGSIVESPKVEWRVYCAGCDAAMWSVQDPDDRKAAISWFKGYGFRKLCGKWFCHNCLKRMADAE